MGYTRDLLHGLAQLLAADGVGVYRDTGVYTDAETGIVIGRVPQSPPAIVALIPYPLTDDPTLSDSVLGLQLRFRVDGYDPRDVTDLADAAFDSLQGHPGANLSPTARLLIAERTSGVPLGEDSNGRPEWSDSYQLTLHRPSRHRT
jgi:hypothetical protein